MHIFSSVFESPLGNLKAQANEKWLLWLEFTEEPIKSSSLNCSILTQAEKELKEYFSWTRKHFSLPLFPSGTEFQKLAWSALERIPYGETRSYKEEAILAWNPKAIRAIGWANNKNPIIIIIPCHRVIGANGDLVGYGAGIERKKWLLDFEKHHS